MSKHQPNLTKQELMKAEGCGGIDNLDDPHYFMLQETPYYNKPDHQKRSIANDNGQHLKHRGKETEH